jgi:pyridoxine 5-phosphate synthase
VASIRAQAAVDEALVEDWTDQLARFTRLEKDRVATEDEVKRRGFQLAAAKARVAAQHAAERGLGLNAGHDLDRENLAFFAHRVPGLLEVSIGHALICDALLFGLENTVQLYLRELR